MYLLKFALIVLLEVLLEIVELLEKSQQCLRTLAKLTMIMYFRSNFEFLREVKWLICILYTGASSARRYQRRQLCGMY